jgi:hypothetical protein
MKMFLLYDKNKCQTFWISYLCFLNVHFTHVFFSLYSHFASSYYSYWLLTLIFFSPIFYFVLYFTNLIVVTFNFISHNLVFVQVSWKKTFFSQKILKKYYEQMFTFTNVILSAKNQQNIKFAFIEIFYLKMKTFFTMSWHHYQMHWLSLSSL